MSYTARPTVRVMLAVLATVALFSFTNDATAQVTLPYVEDFESTMGETYQVDTASLTGAPDFGFFTSSQGNGRLRMNAGAGYAQSGAGAATLDKAFNGGGDVANDLVLTLNMTNYAVANDLVELTFSFMDHGDENDLNDRVWVRGSSLGAWIEVANLNQLGTTGFYETVVVDLSTALAGGGQDFTATFQLRFGQQDNFSSQSVTTFDGFTFDDISLDVIAADDVAVTAILSPGNGTCGGSMTDVAVEVTNLGSNSQSAIPVTIDVVGDATFMGMTTAVGPLLNGDSEIVSLPVDLFSAQNITVTASTQLAGDLVPGNDAATGPVTLSLGAIPGTTSPTICAGSTTTLSVTPEPMVTYEWYDVPTGGMPLATGDTFTTPSVSAPTTFYVQRALGMLENLGAVDALIGSVSGFDNFDFGLVFDVTAPTVVLQQVYVYPVSTGDVTINLLDSNDVVLQSATVTVAAVNQKTPIPLGFTIPQGTGYQLNAAGSTVTQLFRNSNGAMYPYTGTGVTITGTINNLTAFYYYFYDWEVQSASGCAAERTPAMVSVSGALCNYDVSIDKTGPANAMLGDTIDYTVTVTNSGPDPVASVVVTDPTVEGLTFVSNTGDCSTAYPCDLGLMDAGETRTITSTYDVASDFGGDAIINVATAVTSGDADPSNDSDDAVTTIDSMGTGGGGTGGEGGSTTSVGGGASSGGSDAGGGGEGGAGNGGQIIDSGCGCHVVGSGSNGDRGSKSESLWLLVGLGLLVGARRRRRAA
jgi:uncharacterized repeat protein (TIGR01451 family)/MYXO-CTERM domain-containing protein